MKILNPTFEEISSVLDYCRITGNLYWKVDIYSGRSNSKIQVKNGSVAGSFKEGYIKIQYKKQGYQAHRLAWLLYYGVNPEGQIDHQDQDKLNNSIYNLRDIPQKENMKNKPMYSSNTSGITGVSFYEPRGKWVAQITINKKKYHLGCFEDFEGAVKARKEAEIKYNFHLNHGIKKP